MSLIKQPQFQTPNPDGSAFREMGQISRGAAQADLGRGVAQLGNQLQNVAAGMAEYQDRQIRFALKNVSVDLEQERKAFEVEIGRRPDLHKFGGDGIQGFDRAPDEYADHLEKLTQKAAEQVHPNYRQQWLQSERQENESKVGNLRAAMIDKQLVHNQGVALGYVDKLAYGDPERGILPDPNGAMRSLIEGLEVVPSTMQEKYLATGMETIARRAISHDPEWGAAFVEKNKEYFTAQKRDELLNGARDDIAAARVERDRKAKAMVTDNDRKITAAVLEKSLTQPSEIIRRMKSDDPSEQVSEETGRMMVDRLLEKKKPTPEESRAAFGALHRAIIGLEQGKTTPEEWQAAVNTHANNLPDEKVYPLLERAEEVFSGQTKQKTNQFTPIRYDAEKLTTETLRSLYPTGAGTEAAGEGQTPNQLLLDAAVGDALERLEKIIATKPKDQPIDALGMRREYIRIIGEVYQEELKKKNAANAKGPHPITKIAGAAAKVAKEIAGAGPEAAKEIVNQESVEFGGPFNIMARIDAEQKTKQPVVVRMKSPQGKWKEFSADQADEAAKHGWTYQ